MSTAVALAGESLSLWVPDEPLPMKRPRVTVRGGRAHAYVPEQSLRAEDRIRVHVARQLPEGWRPISTAVTLHFTAWLAMPKSIPLSRQHTAQPTKRPDIANFAALLADALEGVVYDNDARIIDLFGCKRYAVECAPGWSIRVFWHG